jgi:hypothetical protein
MPLPNIGSMDGNTGRSEGATAVKAVPFPCAVLDPNRSFVELRVREPRPGARSVSSPRRGRGPGQLVAYEVGLARDGRSKAVKLRLLNP